MQPASETESALQRMVTAYVITGLLFMLLPGTFLGVWNLVSISGRHSLAALSPAWLQAHGHAQIFGWLGTFIIGIGYYSLSKMGKVMPFAIRRGWITWALWTAGVALRWTANVTEFRWRILLPISAALELTAFAIFFATVSRHKPAAAPVERRPMEAWMKLVVASTLGFLSVLVVNQVEAVVLAMGAFHPEIPHRLDQRYLFLVAWGFPVWAVWGFNARWLPVFLGIRAPSSRGLMLALTVSVTGLFTVAFGQLRAATALLLAASVLAIIALNVFRRAEKPAKTLGVTSWFPTFVRGSYVWLLIAGGLGVYAVQADTTGGVWGASRHALTVGFLSTMVFAIGQRVLPAFCGGHVLYSKGLMWASLATLNLGCLLRVGSEIPAYEANVRMAWRILPISAVTELTAVTLFALNLGITLLLPLFTRGERPSRSDRRSDTALYMPQTAVRR
jgi:uncharacterized protein involved in response to NO